VGPYTLTFHPLLDRQHHDQQEAKRPVKLRHRQLVAHLCSLLNDATITPAEFADAAVIALERRLSAGAWGTYQQSDRGMLLLDLYELAKGDIQLHYVTAAMLPRLEVREHLFAEARAAIADDEPAQEFLVLVWLPASMAFSRRKRLAAGPA